MSETRAKSPRGLPCVEWFRRRSATTIITGLLLFAGCLSGRASNQQSTSQVPTAAKVDEFLIVDCLLPGQIRQLGRSATYVTRRQPIKTSARECEIRGGEYVAYDRANFATALKVWLPEAQRGDPAAQTYVGEIYEKGLGLPPDYAAAADWYRRAAEKGYSRAAINLGNLYEQGLGVPRDPNQALNWYRRASGLPGLKFEIMPQRDVSEIKKLQAEVAGLQRALKEKQEALTRTQSELDDLRRALEQKRSEANLERAALAGLRQELEKHKSNGRSTTDKRIELQKSVKEQQARLDAKDRELASLRATLTELQAQSTAQRNEIDILRKGSPDAAPKVGFPLPTRGISFGNYHALVIGNTNYESMPRLETAVADAKAVAALLREQYGYKVKLLLNAGRDEILTELYGLKKELTPDDNLLIYYAGHGEIDRGNDAAHWLPIDAHPHIGTKWVHTRSISEILNVMVVKQLLVVADSCYAGAMAGSAVPELTFGSSNEDNLKLLQLVVQLRSRLVLSSGGVEPVIDKAGDQRHSPFAQRFVDLLRNNVGVLPGREMFRSLKWPVAIAAHDLKIRQIPQYGPIKYAGLNEGDFLFVRTTN